VVERAEELVVRSSDIKTKEWVEGDLLLRRVQCLGEVTYYAMHRWTRFVYLVGRLNWIDDMGRGGSQGEGWMGKFIKKAREMQEKQSTKGGKANDAVLAKKLPALYEFLTENTDDEGNERQTSTLLCFCEDGMFKVMLNDRDAGQTLWASGGSFETALEALEVMLQAPNAPWRVSGPPKGGKKR